MLPYFAASCHSNYCRYISLYVREMQNLPAGAKADLLKGAHVCRHSDGGHLFLLTNYGEQTYIRKGKCAGGMNGFSTSPDQASILLNSLSICAHLEFAMDKHYRDQIQSHPDEISKIKSHHK